MCPSNRSSSPAGAGPVHAWEPALSQMRQLTPLALQELISSWLQRAGCVLVETRETQSGSATFQAAFDGHLLPQVFAVRIHQRRSRLQTHHVDAFAGHLLRAGLAIGILIGTGACTEAAEKTAASYRFPRIRLLSGPQWLAELRARRVGVQRRRFWSWMLRPTRYSRPPQPRDRERRTR